MDPTTVAIFSIVANIVLAIIGTLLKRMLDSSEKRIDENERRLNQHQIELSQLREVLPQHYVRRDDVKDLSDNIFSALRRIEDKLDKKADRL